MRNECIKNITDRKQYCPEKRKEMKNVLYLSFCFEPLGKRGKASVCLLLSLQYN